MGRLVLALTSFALALAGCRTTHVHPVTVLKVTETVAAEYAAPSVPMETQINAVRQMFMKKNAFDFGSCTAWHMSGAVWWTAKHCVQGSTEMWVGGNKVLGQACHAEADACIVLVGGEHTASDTEFGPMPEFGDKIHYIGYPWHFEYHHGVYDGRWGKETHHNYGGGVEKEYEMTDTLADGGASGSPVFNEAGQVVGILVAGYPDKPYTYAVPVTVLQDLALALQL